MKLASKVARPATIGGGGGGSLRLISTRGSLGGESIATGKQQMTSTRVKICTDVTSIQVAYAGERASSLASGITVKAAVWKDGALVGALTFGGNSTVTIAAAELAISDELSVSLAIGDQIDIRTLATVASGSNMWCCQYLNGFFNDGYETGTTVTDKTTSGTVTAAPQSNSAIRGYTPAGVLGISSRPSVLVAGDSISIGTGDEWQVGYLGLAFERNLISYLRTGAGGSTGSAGVTLIETDTQIRAMCAYVTAGSWQYGVNGLAAGNSSTTLRTQAADWLAEFRTLVPSSKASISTIMPVVDGTGNGPRTDSYWDSTKDAERITYNNSLRSGMPTGYDYLWEAAGDASAASGLFRGAEATKDSGTFRTDYGSGAIQDGLHPGRPIITAAAGAVNVTAFLGVQTLWGPEISSAAIPTSGLYAECLVVPSRHPVAETPGTVSGITIGGSNVVVMSKVDDQTIRLYCYDRIGTGTKSIVVSSTNIAGNTGAVMTTGTFTTTNNSTWIGSTDSGTLIASDDFNRTDTSYNASANNNAIGANWTDRAGSGAKITSNKLVLQGQDARVVYWNATDYSNVAAEIEFDPADSTASSSDPFSLRVGVRWQSDNSGIFVGVNRKGDLAALTRLEIYPRSDSSAFGTTNNTNITLNNGTTYRLRLEVSGTGAGKTITGRLLNASSGVEIASKLATSNVAGFTDLAGKVAVVGSHTANNNTPTALPSEVVLDNFVIRELTDATAPVFDSAELSDSGQYVDVAITELGLPLLPTSAAAGFSLSTGTISETVVYGADRVRVVLASTGSLPLTLSYSQAAGNITDQSSNELTAFTGETVT